MVEKYAVITCTDGNFVLRSEWTDPVAAIKAYHGLAQTLWNDDSFSQGYIAILDSQLDRYQEYKEFITHAQPTPVEPEQNEE